MARLQDTTLFHDANLVSYWKFENNSNDSAPAGNANNGSDTSVSYAAGKYGQGASFNGSSSFVNVPDAGSLDITTDVSIVGWIKYAGSDIGAESAMGWFFKGNNSPARSNYTIVWNGSGTGTGQGVLNFYNGSNNASDAFTWSTPTAQHHFAITATSGGNVKFYFDGVQVGSTKIMSGVLSANVDALTLGKVGGFGQFLNGMMDDWAIFNRILGSTEVANLATDPGTTTSTSTSSSTTTTSTSTTTTSTSTTTTSTSRTTTSTSTSRTTTSTSTTTTSTSTSITTSTTTSTSTTTTSTSTTTTSTSMPISFIVDKPGDQ